MGLLGKADAIGAFSASQRRQLQTPETARTAGRSGGCGGACDAMPLSCFFFRPAKVCRKRLTSGFNPLVGTGTLFFPERRTQGVLATLGVGLFEEFCHTIAGGSLLHLPELPLIECFEYTLDRANGVEQISVQGSAIFASYHRRLRVDETFLLQLPHILCHRIFTHADRMADGFVTGVALVGLTILAPEQIGIEGDLTKIQTDAEYLVWYHKIVFLCTALGPFVETQFIPPVLS